MSKIQITFKDPDALNDCIRESIEREDISGLSDAEKDAVIEVRINKAREICDRWFRYGEYLTVEVDVDEETITVLEE